MLDHLARALTLALITLGLVGLTQLPSPASAADMDCGDFATQAAAQTYFINHGGPRNDPDQLDADGDGIACESNPCPCSTNTGGGGGGGTTPPPGGGGGGNTNQVKRTVGNVTRIVDGDTLRVRIRGVGIRAVRLIGIDAPEKTRRVECGAKKASQRLRELAPVGSSVVLFTDPSQPDRDTVGRLLRYVHRNGKDIGRAQLNKGQAQVYLVSNKRFRRIDDYRRVQRNARNNARGLWYSCW